MSLVVRAVLHYCYGEQTLELDCGHTVSRTGVSDFVDESIPCDRCALEDTVPMRLFEAAGLTPRRGT